MRDLTDLITDYTTSEHFLFLDASLKEHAESLLHFWVEKTGQAPTFDSASKALDQIGRLDLPLDIRKAVPHLLKEFFGYISSTGRAPEAAQWSGFLLQLEGTYVSRFREDGSMRGETFKKNYTDVGRNDPCPCGSGKKFKKCCMPLIS